jgi:hypothetical protein
MESVHIDFSKGISAVVDPKLIGNGYAVFLENVDLSGVSAKSVRAPTFIQDVTTGAKDLFEYRGKWHFSTGRREWAAEYVGRQERLYYKDIELGTTDRQPFKVIDNVAVPLGTIRPKTAPLISEAGLPIVTGITIAIEGSLLESGGVSYRIGLRTSSGLLPASEPIIISTGVQEATNTSWANRVFRDRTTVPRVVKLSWTAISYNDTTKPIYDDIKSIVIYGRTSGEEQILDEIGIDQLTYRDDGLRTPSGQYAKTSDETNLFYYFYTFSRDANGHLSESGPSPTYGPLQTFEARKVVRSPLLEGLFDNGHLFEAAELTTTATVQDDDIVGQFKRTPSDKTYITTLSAHGLSTGDPVGIIHLHAGTDSKLRDQIYPVTVPAAVLPKPGVTELLADNAGTGGWAQGTTLNVSVAAFRGASWASCYGGRPAETAIASGDIETLVVGTPIGGLNRLAKVKWTIASSDHDGFHVYLNGGLLATIDKNTLFYEFGTATPDMAKVPPATDVTRTRVFSLPKAARGIAWDSTLADDDVWGHVAYDPATKVTMVDPTECITVDGDLVYFSTNMPEIPGYFTVDMDEDTHGTITAGDFYVHALTESNHTLAGTQQCKVAGAQARCITKWNLYVARGDTGAFLLQGVYDIDETSIVDVTPVEGLSTTCESDYMTAGLNGESINVVFEPPPSDLHGITLHNSSLWGIVDRTVRWTPINRPDAWPDAFTRDFTSEPWALASYGGTLLVLCSDGIYRMDGTDPAGMQCHKTLAEDGIIAPYSLQSTAAGLVFLTRRGLVAFRAQTNNTEPISEDKMGTSVLLSASGTPEDDTFPFWCIPSRHGAFWAKLTRDLPTADPNRLERTMSDSLPLTWPLLDIRSFYHKGKYYLYYPQMTGAANAFKMHGTVVVDCTKAGYPMTTLGIKPMAVHVSESGRVFAIMNDPYVFPGFYALPGSGAVGAARDAEHIFVPSSYGGPGTLDIWNAIQGARTLWSPGVWPNAISASATNVYALAKNQWGSDTGITSRPMSETDPAAPWTMVLTAAEIRVLCGASENTPISSVGILVTAEGIVFAQYWIIPEGTYLLDNISGSFAASQITTDGMGCKMQYAGALQTIPAWIRNGDGDYIWYFDPVVGSLQTLLLPSSGWDVTYSSVVRTSTAWYFFGYVEGTRRVWERLDSTGEWVEITSTFVTAMTDVPGIACALQNGNLLVALANSIYLWEYDPATSDLTQVLLDDGQGGYTYKGAPITICPDASIGQVPRRVWELADGAIVYDTQGV